MHFRTIGRGSISRNIVAGTVCSLLGVVSGCGEEPEVTRSERARLVAVCAEGAETVPDGAWLCGESRTAECDAHPGTASPAAIYVVRPDGCENAELIVDEGPFVLGESEIVVTERVVPADPGDPDTREVCRSMLVVVDTTPPSLAPLESAIWPPNHKLHAITAADCAGAVDACDPTLDVRFTEATSDEPVDAEGDGSHEPDIVFASLNGVSVRAERQGGENGRVYTLGFVARDDSGNVAEGACSVSVPHDSSGRAAVADPSAYVVRP
jgi:hypothetical protein